jgi:uncharacterized cofD-like protein
MGLRILAIGGGTGLATLLGGLKRHVGSEVAAEDGLTAVVTVTDNGGSSGRLREEFNILPPGDIRNCMAALAEDEQLLTRLFRHRFASDGTLSGHSFGNLFLTALTDVMGGDFLAAIRASSEVLAIKGRIFPSTMERVHLEADLADGRVVRGETQIARAGSPIARIRLSCPECRPLGETLEAISNADLIVLGPGSLFSSVIPNLLVPGIAEAIAHAPAPVLYIANCMTQAGETNGFTVEDHLRALAAHAPLVAPEIVLVNALPISEAAREAYLEEGAVQVALGFGRPDALPEPGEREIVLPGAHGRTARMLSLNVVDERKVVRHDGTKLARAVVDIARLAHTRIAAF